MTDILDFSEIQSDGLRSCPVTYKGTSGKEYKFTVIYRPEAITPEVMIAFEKLQAAYEEQTAAEREGRKPLLKVDLTATSKVLAAIIAATGLTKDSAPIESSEAFYLSTSYQFQSAITAAVMGDYANPISAMEDSSSSSPDSSIAEPNTAESQVATS